MKEGKINMRKISAAIRLYHPQCMCVVGEAHMAHKISGHIVFNIMPIMWEDNLIFPIKKSFFSQYFENRSEC